MRHSYINDISISYVVLVSYVRFVCDFANFLTFFILVICSIERSTDYTCFLAQSWTTLTKGDIN